MDWFDTGGDTSGDADPKFDLTGVYATYPQVGGEAWAGYRFETGETKEKVTSTVGIVGYLDTDHSEDDPYVYETRFFTMRSEFYEGPQNGNKDDVVLVIQQWSDSTQEWQTTSFLTYQDGADLTGARPERDGGNCGNTDASCRGWLFDSSMDLAPSHAAPEDRVGVVVLKMTMADLGATTAPALLATTYNATAPLTDGATTVAHNIFDDGNPCNDPASPYYDVTTGTCTTSSTFQWKDSVSGESALATPVTIDLVERVPAGLRVSLIAVHGPTVLELWWQRPGEAFIETDAHFPVREPGIYTLVEQREREAGRYVVVDRGIDRVFGIYTEDGDRLDALELEGSTRLERRPRKTGRERLTRRLQHGNAGTHVEKPARAGPQIVVEVQAARAVARVPARVGGRSVGALWLEGERHTAFACAAGVSCALVPPADASRPAPLHRAALVEFGPTRPVQPAPQAATEGQALLVERRRLATKNDISQWPYPLEQSRAFGWLMSPWFPTSTFDLDGTARKLVALELEVLSRYPGDEQEHTLSVSLDGDLIEDFKFQGPRAQLRIGLETSFAAAPRLLTLSTSERAGGKREFLALTGAVLEQALEPHVGNGFHALVRRAGALSLDEDAVVIVRRRNGSENAWRLRAGETLSLGEGDEVAVTPARELSGSTETLYDVPSLAELAAADVVVLVGAPEGRMPEAVAALSPWIATLEAHGGPIAVTSLAALSTAFGVPPNEGVERAVAFLSSERRGPRAVIVVGSGTLVPESELPADGPLHVPAPRRWHDGYNFSSDVAPALDAAAAGGRLVPVTRVPVSSLHELASVSARLAELAGVGEVSKAIVVADSWDDFSSEASRTAAAMLAAELEVTVVDARAAGRTQASRDMRDAVMQGVGTLWYVGHGSFQGLGSGLIQPSKLRSWANAGAPGFTLVAMTCHAGNVGAWGTNRMTDMMFRWRTPVRGGLLGAGDIDMRMHRRASDAIVHAARTHTELGAVWAAGMRRLLDAGVPPAELSVYALVGDPFAPLR